ncbi:MAG: zinc-ribbon domain-containing protein [Clostridia bacterium]|nr:zinc-ribbon domain-containing protein [Clostridia bacterium]
MKYCSNCGKELADAAVVCPGCGHMQPKAAATVNKSTVYLIWSIVLIVVCNPIASILGIIALVYTAKAGSSSVGGDAEKDIGIARTLCIVATCIDALTFVTGVIVKLLSFLGLFGLHWFRIFW